MKAIEWCNGVPTVFDVKGTAIKSGQKIVYTTSLSDRLLFGVVDSVVFDNNFFKELKIKHDDGKISRIWTTGPRPHRAFVYD